MYRLAYDRHDTVARWVIQPKVLDFGHLAQIEMYSTDRDDIKRMLRRRVQL